MQTTHVVGLITLVAGASGVIVSIALVAREQPIAWVGVLVGLALLRVAYGLLRGAGRPLPAERP
jgi:hypothetical protein